MQLPPGFRKPDSALVLIGHGSTLNPDSSAPTYQHEDALKALGVFGEVVSTFWKEEPSMRDVLHMVESPEVYFVPLFISEGYFTMEVIPRELELDGKITHRDGRTLKYCDPVGIHPSMTRLLVSRAEEVAPDVPPEETTLLIVGHGTNLNDHSKKAIEDQVEIVSREQNYGKVMATYMEEAPLISDWKDFSAGSPNVVVVPFFIADGLHSYQDIPVMLGIEKEPTEAASQRSVFRHNPYQVDDQTLYYSSAIGTEPLMAEVILDQVLDFDRLATEGALCH